MINQFQLHCCVVNKFCDENECLFKSRRLIINSNSQLIAQLVLTAQLGVDALMLSVVLQSLFTEAKAFFIFKKKLSICYTFYRR